MNYSDQKDYVTIGKTADTYNLLAGNDRIKLDPYSYNYVDRILNTEGWGHAKIDGGDGNDTIWMNYHLYNYSVESLVKLSEPVDGWVILTDTIDGNTYTASIRNIEQIKGMTHFEGNSEDNKATSASIAYHDISMIGGGGDDELTVKNSSQSDRGYSQTITVDGGTGDDKVFVYSKTSDVTLILDGGEGYDTLTFGEGTDRQYGSCIPCVQIDLGRNDSIIGFEKIEFADNVAQQVFISNAFLSNMKVDSMTFEGGRKTQIIFTDDIQLVHPEIEENCKDGYIHYQVELMPETSSFARASADTPSETPVMMDIFIASDVVVIGHNISDVYDLF